MALEISTLRDRPDLAEERAAFGEDWPAFMSQDPSCRDLASVHHLYPALQLVAREGARTVATAQAAPIHWSGDDADLPPQGWDDVVGAAVRGACGGQLPPNAVSALSITVDAAQRGRGLSSRMLSAMRDAAQAEGFSDLIAPVRPTLKHLEPRTPMAEYAARTRHDGLPWDPWLRVHVRAGGRIVATCPASKTIASSLAQWRNWTGLALDQDGDIEINGALSPLNVSLTHDRAVYVEPNVWVHHRLAGSMPAQD